MLLGDANPDGTFRQQLIAALQDPEVVNILHQYSDYDTTPDGLHRSQGLRHDQSSYGDHTHDSKNSSGISQLIGDPVTISDSIGLVASLSRTSGYRINQTYVVGSQVRIRVRKTNAGSVGNATWAGISMNQIDEDNSAWYNSSTGMATVPVGMGGIYIVSVGNSWDTALAGGVGILAVTTDSTSAGNVPGRDSRPFSAGNGIEQSLTRIVRLVSGSKVGPLIWQNSGGIANLRTSTFDVAPYFELVGPVSL